MDLQIANWFYQTFGSNEIFLKIIKAITHLGDAISIITIIAIMLIFKKTRKVGIYAAISVLIAFLINNYLLKTLIDRERPYEINPELLNVMNLVGYEMPSGSSMPSGHSLASMTLAFSIFLHNKKYGIMAIVLSVIIGLTRMILCVHFLTDVLVGFIIGIMFAIMFHYLIKFIIKKYMARKGENKWKKLC